MDTRSEAQEIATSLATLSTFYGANTLSSRRNLRSTIENEVLRVNNDFLKAAEGVITALDAVQADLDRVAQCCDRMTASVLDNKASTAGLLLETERLQHALDTSLSRSQLLGKFLDQYQLSAAEAEALHAESITDTFFSALDHVRSIHANCKSLLRTHHQRAGLELLDSMATLQEGAYERLCRWVQSECRGLSDVDSPEVNPLLQRAVAALRSRSVLYKYCAEEVATARQSALFQRFIRALTRGPRPIEMHAPDPWRYASDMLAWVHASLASEREFLVALFGEDPAPGATAAGEEEVAMEAAVEGDGAGGAATSDITLAQLMDTVFEGICRPLRVRLEQVLMSSPPPLLCFRLSHLLTFYLRTVDGMLGVSSQLADALRACRSMAMRTLNEHLRHRGDKLVRYPPPPPPDLSLPAQLAEGAALAADLIDSYETSLAHGGSGASAPDDPTDLNAVLAAVLDPLVTAVERSSEALNPKAAGRVDDGAHLDPADQRIYVINCLYALQRPLLGHACAAQRLEALNQATQTQMSGLAAAEVQRTLKSSGLEEVAERLALYQRSRAADVEGTPAADPALSLPRVAEAMRTFFGKLSDPAALPEFRRMQAPLLKAEAVQRSLTALAKAYSEVYEAVTDPACGYAPAEVAQLVRHTPDQVKTLLGVA